MHVLVGIIMGSQSDWDTMKHAADTLDSLGVPYETRAVSAHRTPDRMFEYAEQAAERRLQAIIAGAARLASGELGSRVAVPEAEELGTLADSLNRLAGEGDAVSGAFLAVDRAFLPEIYRRLEERPTVAGIEESRARLANFHASIGEFLLTYMSFIVGLSAAITFGIVYNAARIAFAERARDLAAGDALDLFELLHEVGPGVEATGGVDEHLCDVAGSGCRDGVVDYGGRICTLLLVDDRRADTFRPHLELVHGGSPEGKIGRAWSM